MVLKRNRKMVIGLVIVVVIVVLAIFLLGSRVAVGESLLVIKRDDAHFPVVSGYNLDRQEFEFPRDFAGDLNLVIVPFQQQQQLDVNTWIPAAQELERSFGVVYYELPTIYKLPTLSRTFINEGMRAGIPDQTSRERTITLYLDKTTFKNALDISSEETIFLFLVDPAGNILWRNEGRYSEGKVDDLVVIIQDFRNK